MKSDGRGRTGLFERVRAFIEACPWGASAKKGIADWLANSGVGAAAGASEAAEIAANLEWLAARIGKGSDAEELLKQYLAGVGAGKVGLLTLNQIAIDLKVAGASSFDASTLERFMRYEDGVAGRKRISVGAARNFSVDFALRVAAGEKSVKESQPAEKRGRFEGVVPGVFAAKMRPVVKEPGGTAKGGQPDVHSGERQAVVHAPVKTKPAVQGGKPPEVVGNTPEGLDTTPQEPVIARETTKIGTMRPLRVVELRNYKAPKGLGAHDFYKILGKNEPPKIVLQYTQGVSNVRSTPELISNDPNFSARQNLLRRHIGGYKNKNLAKKLLDNMDEKGVPRPNGEGISLIVFHCTEAYDTSDPKHPVPAKDQTRWALASFNEYGDYENGLNLGAHFLIKEDGTILQLAPIETLTMHAMGFNLTTIGVEIAASSGDAVNAKQVEAAALLSAYLMKKYREIKYVAGHFELYDESKPYAALFEPNGDLTLEEVRKERKPDPGKETIEKIRSEIVSNGIALVTTKEEQRLLATRRPPPEKAREPLRQ